jgi:hypothetical protein
VLVLRVDDDFWTVAVLPFSLARIPLEDVVADLWPGLAEEASYLPDSGSVEQRIHYAHLRADDERKANLALHEEVADLRRQLYSLRRGRLDLVEFNPTRKSAESGYFIRRWQHLVTATAHEFAPRADPAEAAVCERCGLLQTEPVHSRHYIALHERGYPCSMRHLLDYDGGGEHVAYPDRYRPGRAGGDR